MPLIPRSCVLIICNNCDRIWQNPPCSEFYDILASYIFDKVYLSANSPASLGSIAELECFVCDRITPTKSNGLKALLCTCSTFPDTTDVTAPYTCGNLVAHAWFLPIHSNQECTFLATTLRTLHWYAVYSWWYCCCGLIWLYFPFKGWCQLLMLRV